MPHSLPAVVALPTIPPPPFHNLELGPFTLHGYGLCMGIAIIVAITVCEWGLRRQHVNPARFTPLALLAVAAGFVGARLYHVASQPVRYAHHPGEIVQVWHGGLGIYGAVLAGAAVGLAVAPRFGIPRRAVADASTPALLLAQGIGRAGNYLNQELFGKPFDGAWALRVDVAHRPAGLLDQATYHPTFAYEGLANLVLAALFAVLLVRWRSRPRGVLFPLYVVAYSTARILVEPLRIDEAHTWHGVRQNVWVAGALIIAGLLASLWMWRRDRRERA